MFQGREFSSATGLYNFRARWYDPKSGRWLSKDPIGLEGGLNLYAFCGDDPVNGMDPMGTDAAGAVKGATLGFALGLASCVGVDWLTGGGAAVLDPAIVSYTIALTTLGGGVAGAAAGGGTAASSGNGYGRGGGGGSDEGYLRGKDARDRSTEKLKEAWERLKKTGEFDGSFDEFRSVIEAMKDRDFMTPSMKSQNVNDLVNFYRYGGRL